jgi:2-keto-4-pentenoate hydratase/2-oxohepta-3-ene-1,7-dioic acid hydratase in catechol pathway
MVTAAEMTDPNRLMIWWQITRNQDVVSSGEISTAALKAGDVVTIRMEQIGELTNPAIVIA